MTDDVEVMEGFAGEEAPVLRAEFGYLFTPEPDAGLEPGTKFEDEAAGEVAVDEGLLIPQGEEEGTTEDDETGVVVFFGSPRTASRRAPGADDTESEETDGGGGPAAFDSIGSGSRVSSRFVSSTLGLISAQPSLESRKMDTHLR